MSKIHLIAMSHESRKNRYQLGEITEHGIMPFSNNTFYTKTDVENCIDAMIKNKPDQYAKTNK